MEAVMISIQPKWCDLIIDGRKTVELRKSKPKIDLPFKCYIYETKTPLRWNKEHNDIVGGRGGKVIGEFVCDSFLYHCEMGNADIAEITSCVRREDIREYANGKEVFGWHISDLKIYDRPKELSEFIKPCQNDLYCEVCAMYSEFSERCNNAALQILRPPQSWFYVKELEAKAK